MIRDISAVEASIIFATFHMTSTSKTRSSHAQKQFARSFAIADTAQATVRVEN